MGIIFWRTYISSLMRTQIFHVDSAQSFINEALGDGALKGHCFSSECVCVYERKGKSENSVCACTCERGSEREKENDESACVFVCVCACMLMCTNAFCRVMPPAEG